ncbi:sensor histidine kinase [Niabella ginsengisoli]|uniref:histidine kinase n=1 Tax=Niabella ginsengisoli TaxID=522298 RepID=A0ABS9SFC7_9BACT|nr:histidine kinase dimerization/phosphoacceptor domain -containing protein [Niabella ginsengisoli]MCH5597069.1 hypothetical protein [Niabella ginsengisoli]
MLVSLVYYLKIRKKNNELLISNNKKDVLIQEIHHRVKNNFQIISGLMNLQLKSITDPESQKLFQEAVQRIHSMALIHQQLYSGDNFDRVKIVPFLNEILCALAHSDLRSQNFLPLKEATQRCTSNKLFRWG